MLTGILATVAFLAVVIAVIGWWRACQLADDNDLLREQCDRAQRTHGEVVLVPVNRITTPGQRPEWVMEN